MVDQIGSAAPTPDYNQVAGDQDPKNAHGKAVVEKRTQVQEEHAKLTENLAELTQKMAELQDELNSGNATTAKGQAKQQQKMEDLNEQIQSTTQELSDLAEQLSQLKGQIGESLAGIKGQGAPGQALGADSIQSHADTQIEPVSAKAASASWATMSPAALETVMNGDPVLPATKSAGVLPAGPTGTGNAWFAPNSMITVLIYFTELMNMQKELTRLATKLALLSIASVKGMAEDQKAMTLAAGKESANQHIASAVKAGINVAISAAQLGAAVKAASQAGARLNKTMDDAGKNLENAKEPMGGIEEVNKYNTAKSAASDQTKQIEKLTAENRKLEVNFQKNQDKIAENKAEINKLNEDRAVNQEKITKFEGVDENGNIVNKNQNDKFTKYNDAEAAYQKTSTEAFTTYMQERSTRVLIFNNAMEVMKNSAEAFTEVAIANFTLQQSAYQGQAEYYGAMIQILTKGLESSYGLINDANSEHSRLVEAFTGMQEKRNSAMNMSRA